MRSTSATPRDRRLVDLGALDEEHVQALVAVLGEEQVARRLAVAARAAGLLVVGLDRLRARVSWQTVRTSALSTPIPNALVATTTRTSPVMKRRWASARASRAMPAW